MSCDICKKAFNILWRRDTKCKRCNRIICTDCSKLQQVRDVFRNICKVCMQDCETIKKIISDSLLAWNHNSQIAKKYWVKDVEFIKQVYKLNKDVKSSKIARDVKTIMQTPMNYSIQEFFNLLIFNNRDVESTITNVVDTFVTRNPKVGYNQYLIKLTIFLLCFCKDYVCLKILEDLYHKIPKQYYPEYQTTQEFIKDHDYMQHDAIQDVKFRFKLEQDQIIAAKQFIESAMMHYKNQFFLNLSFSCAFYILDKIIQSTDSTEIDKFFSVIIQININQLQTKNSELVIARTTTVESIKQYQNQMSKKRSSLYLSVDKCQQDAQLQSQQSCRTVQRKMEISEFEADENENLSHQSPTLLQSQKLEISKLTQELLQLEQQINQLKIENSKLEEISVQNTASLFKEYENSLSDLIDQTEILLKQSMMMSG
ncbi:unnamed protein product [Paramecium sonneborni]|uniref:FYVE-type domain-containing protein n=1 Tax=Paramecium sonneborni TaxID=65129 RepID=A0A8S1RHC9_9CILI|nr:unnamed protein product [Paramecium sonneborni]